MAGYRPSAELAAKNSRCSLFVSKSLRMLQIRSTMSKNAVFLCSQRLGAHNVTAAKPRIWVVLSDVMGKPPKITENGTPENGPKRPRTGYELLSAYSGVLDSCTSAEAAFFSSNHHQLHASPTQAIRCATPVFGPVRTYRLIVAVADGELFPLVSILDAE